MNQNVNNREHLVKQIGPVWKVRVAVYSPVEKERPRFKNGNQTVENKRDFELIKMHQELA